MLSNIIESPQGRRSRYSSFTDLSEFNSGTEPKNVVSFQRAWQRSMSMSPPHHDIIERSVFIGGEDTTGEALLALTATPLRAPSAPHLESVNRLQTPPAMASQTFFHAADSHDPSFAQAMRTAVSQLFQAGYGSNNISATLKSVAQFVQDGVLSEDEKRSAMFYLYGDDELFVHGDATEMMNRSISSISTLDSLDAIEPLTLANPENRHYYVCGEQGEGEGVHMREACALVWNCIERWESLHPTTTGLQEALLMREAFAARLAELGQEARCTNGQLALLVQVLQGYYREVQLDLLTPVTPNALVQYLGLQLYGRFGQDEEHPDQDILNAMAQQTVDQAAALYRDLPQADDWVHNVSQQITEFYGNQYGHTWHSAAQEPLVSETNSVNGALGALGLSYVGARPE